MYPESTLVKCIEMVMTLFCGVLFAIVLFAAAIIGSELFDIAFEPTLKKFVVLFIMCSVSLYILSEKD